MQRKTTSHMVRYFTGATLLPLLALTCAALWGGIWALLALLYMTALVFCFDQLVALSLTPEDANAEFPEANVLSILLALGHFALLPLVIWALTNGSHGGIERLMIFISAGLFMGQVSNSNAHELIHRSDPTLRRLGTWVYISLLFGHHASAHPQVHHRHVATALDPNSAPMGMSYYRFLPRAWIGSFKAGLKAETARLAKSPGGEVHPFVIYLGGAVFCLCLAFVIGGFVGVIKYGLLALYASSQLMLSDYVQHYGLRRHLDRDTSRPEPVGTQHSWNSPQWFSQLLMLNAPRHSDHHAKPMKPYVALELDPEMPMLPRSLPAMGALALVPSLWRRVMDPRVLALHPPSEPGSEIH